MTAAWVDTVSTITISDDDDDEDTATHCVSNPVDDTRPEAEPAEDEASHPASLTNSSSVQTSSTAETSVAEESAAKPMDVKIPVSEPTADATSSFDPVKSLPEIDAVESKPLEEDVLFGVPLDLPDDEAAAEPMGADFKKSEDYKDVGPASVDVPTTDDDHACRVSEQMVDKNGSGTAEASGNGNGLFVLFLIFTVLVTSTKLSYVETG